MEYLEVRTVVYCPPEDVYALLEDFPRYARYSDYLRSVTESDGTESGPVYTLRFGWWKVEYTVRSRVTETDPPNRIGFEITSGIEAEGEWVIEPAPDRTAADEASHVRFVVRYDPETVAGSRVSLPALVSMDWVIETVTPMLAREAERVVSRVVADLEGTRRDVDIEIRT